MSVLCVIQARLGSKRLPNKILEPINGRPLIEHVVKRASAIGGVDQVVLAMPDAAPHLHENDVLGRFAHVVSQYPDADKVVRITGDCPLLAPDLAEQVLCLYRETPHVEYAWIDTRPINKGWPDGVDVEVFSRAALLWAQREADDAHDREHVTPWIRRHCKVATLLPEGDYSWLKISVDTAEDLERVRAMAAVLEPNDYAFPSTVKAACLISTTAHT